MAANTISYVTRRPESGVDVIRSAAVRELVSLGEAGAFDLLLEPAAEEQIWQCDAPSRPPGELRAGEGFVEGGGEGLEGGDGFG